MADAKKCDRCGMYYDVNKQHHASCNGNTFIDGMRFTLVNGYELKSIDLCDDCIGKLKKFLEGDNKNVNY